MAHYPITPQLLEPGVPAKDNHPQTQFLSDGDDESNKAAAEAAIAAYAAAEAAGVSPIPPACVAVLTPAAELAS